MDLVEGTLYLDAGRTKARRAEVLPLAPDVLEVLRIRGKGKGPIFKSSPTRRSFMRHVARPGIEYNSRHGQVDRKSLRKMFGTHLAMKGVDLRVTQRLMRHCDPRLTANLYTDPMLLDMRGAVGTLISEGAERKQHG